MLRGFCREIWMNFSKNVDRFSHFCPIASEFFRGKKTRFVFFSFFAFLLFGLSDFPLFSAFFRSANTEALRWAQLKGLVSLKCLCKQSGVYIVNAATHSRL